MADDREREEAATEGASDAARDIPPDTLPDDVPGDALAETPRPRIAASAVRAATESSTLCVAAGGVEGDVAPESAATAGEPPAADVPAEGADAEDADEESRVADQELGEDDLAWRALPLTTRLEALLFAAAQPLSLRRLQALAGDADAEDVRSALASLAAHYDASARAFGLEEIGGGLQLRTRSELSGLLARLGRRRSTEKLSAAALETLAIVAYRQPVLRVDVEKIRGVACGEVLRTLVEKGLVRIAGRADLPGAPLLYGTTPAFLELFGLRSLRDLPSDRELLRAP